MSNEDMNLNNEPCEGTLAPGQWTESLTFQPASPSEKETWFRFGATFNGCLVVNGVNLGPAAELADLVELAAIGRLAVELARAAQGLDFDACSAKGEELGKASAAYLAKQEESKP